MLNKLGIFIRKVVLAFGIIYGIDTLLRSVNVYIPINFVTIGITAFLGIPGLLSIFVLFFLIQ